MAHVLAAPLAAPRRGHPLALQAFVSAAILLVATLGIPRTAVAEPTPRLDLPAGLDPSLVIDLHLQRGWDAHGITPSPPADDRTFLRRLSLDALGRVPTPAEMQEFLAHPDPARRDRWIDRLLADPGHARHLAELFDVMLLGRPEGRRAAAPPNEPWRQYLVEAFAANRSWQAMARDMVLARSTDQTDVRASWFLYARRNEYQTIAESVAPSFFGIRIECAQCHDHPLASEIQQGHYWGLVAFFNRGKNEDTAAGPRVLESSVGGFQKFTDLAGDSHETRLTFFESPVVDEARLPDDLKDSPERFDPSRGSEPAVPKFSRRQQFVDRILLEHPLLARALVNRLWATYLGRGLVHPVDRMDSVHPASHPELLDWLSDDFRRSGYDIRRLTRALLRTRAYQLSSLPPSRDALPEHFAHGLSKPLTAEQLARSWAVATSGAANDELPELLGSFQKAFPDVLPESPQSSPAQALLLSNHAAMSERIRQSSLLRQAIAETDNRLATQTLFATVLGREPDPQELQHATAYLEARRDARQRAMESLLWSLLASAEFYINH
jgi:hypothetical protein